MVVDTFPENFAWDMKTKKKKSAIYDGINKALKYFH